MLVKYPFTHHQFAIHQNIHINYMDEGSGTQTILFIHGLANYAPVWKYQIAELRKTNRCIAIDLPGNGYSSRGDYPYTMFFYAECVVRFIEKMELKNVVLTGHSMGGQIALIIALRYPHLIDKLVLVASAGLEHFAAHEVMMMNGMLNMGTLFYADEFHLESAIRQSFFNTQNESSTIIEELKAIMNAHAMKEWRDMSLSSIKGMLNEQVQQYLPNITTPTLILFGEKDALIPNTLVHFGETPESIAKKAAALIPSASFRMIPQAGHFVQLEKAADVNAAIQTFINTPQAAREMRSSE
ncbi:MAG: alpha/beta hydrolase [Bacteroidota bacterium]